MGFLDSFKNVFMAAFCITYSLALDQWTYRHLRRHEAFVLSKCETTFLKSKIQCASHCEKASDCFFFVYDKMDRTCNISCLRLWKGNFSTIAPSVLYEKYMENKAIHKPVSMSSEWNPPYHKPMYATDGVLSDKLYALECASSNHELSPWLQVDLQATELIEVVVIYNRWEGPGDRLHSVRILLGDDVTMASGQTCGDFTGPAVNAQVAYIPCYTRVRGRYVRVEIQGTNGQNNNLLTVCELEVYTAT